jgi:hypothetical protein
MPCVKIERGTNGDDRQAEAIGVLERPHFLPRTANSDKHNRRTTSPDFLNQGILLRGG